MGEKMGEILFPQSRPPGAWRASALGGEAALVVLQEAWSESRLADVDPRRIGLIIGGSNFQQRELEQIHERYRDNSEFLRPTYALAFMDSDLCGFCTAQFRIRILSYTLART